MSTHRTTQNDYKPLDVIAHRGDPIGHVENTLAAVRSAMAAGATTIEIDVHVSSDGVPVVIHDDSTARLWGRDAAVNQQTRAELSQLRADRSTPDADPEHAPDDEGIPTLAEVLDLAAGRATCLIDLTDAVEAARAVEIAAPHPCTVAYCGALPALERVRELEPDAEIYLTWTDPTPPPAELYTRLRPAWLNPNHLLVDADLVHHVHERGMKLSCWTIDDLATAQRLASLGVDAVTSNRAGELRAQLSTHTSGTGDAR